MFYFRKKREEGGKSHKKSCAISQMVGGANREKDFEQLLSETHYATKIPHTLQRMDGQMQLLPIDIYRLLRTARQLWKNRWNNTDKAPRRSFWPHSSKKHQAGARATKEGQNQKLHPPPFDAKIPNFQISRRACARSRRWKNAPPPTKTRDSYPYNSNDVEAF